MRAGSRFTVAGRPDTIGCMGRSKPSATNILGVVAAVAVCSIATGCATAPTSPPPPLEFTGTIDLSRPGIGFRLDHASGLSCEAHYSGSRLPETFAVPLQCNEQREGMMDAVKRESVHATIKLSDGRTGVATIALPTKPVAVKPVAKPVVASYRPRSAKRGCGSRGGPGYRLPNGKCASWRR